MDEGVKEFTVKSTQRLDKFLAGQMPQVSRGEIQRAIEAGGVFVNGEKVVKPSVKVKPGDSIMYNESSIKEFKSEIRPARQSLGAGGNPKSETNSKSKITNSINKNIKLRILYNDNGLLIIDKPAGLTVHPGAGVKEETLSEILVKQYPEIKNVGETDRPGIVHRLDKDTSGCLLVATTQEMYEYLREAFYTRKVKKEYLALVWGRVEQKHGIIDTPMGKSRVDFRKRTVNDPVEAKEAVTEYFKIADFKIQIADLNTAGFQSPLLIQSLSRTRYGKGARGSLLNGAFKPPSFFAQASADKLTPPYIKGEDKGKFDEMTLLKVLLHTGRTHQIRVHMASIGHPLIGDKLYGPKKTLPHLDRQFLHASKIEVQLPDKTWIEAESEMPEELLGALRKIGFSEVSM